MRSIRLSGVTGKPRLAFLSPTQLDEYRQGIANATGQPSYFTVFGTELELAPTPSEDTVLEMIYRATLDPLVDSTDYNWLLTLAPDAYLYGVLMEAAPYLKEDERVAVWSAGLKYAFDGLNSLGRDQSFGAGPLTMRTSDITP